MGLTLALLTVART